MTGLVQCVATATREWSTCWHAFLTATNPLQCTLFLFCVDTCRGELWFCAGEVRYPGWEDTYEYTTYAEAARRAHASGSATATKLRMPTHTSGPEPDTCGAPRPAPFTPVISRAAKALQRGRDALAVELYRHVYVWRDRADATFPMQLTNHLLADTWRRS